MLDNLREQASSSAYFKEDEDAPAFEEKPAVVIPRARRTFDQVTGTTAQQRFMLAAILLVMFCLVGAMFLVLSEKIVLPFL